MSGCIKMSYGYKRPKKWKPQPPRKPKKPATEPQITIKKGIHEDQVLFNGQIVLRRSNWSGERTGDLRFNPWLLKDDGLWDGPLPETPA